MGKSQRVKGRRFEQIVTNFFKELGFRSRRIALQETDHESKGDVEVYLPGRGRVLVSCKVGKQVPVWPYKALGNDEDLLVFKKDRHNTMVCMELSTFRDMFLKEVS